MRRRFSPKTEDAVYCLVAKSCPTLCYSLPSSSVHGIFQAVTLEWVVNSFSRGVFPTQGLNPCLLHWQADPTPFSYGNCNKKDIYLSQMLWFWSRAMV